MGCDHLKSRCPIHGKESKPIIPSELRELYSQITHHDYGDIKVIDDNILRFESIEHYKRVIDSLQEECDEWCKIFYDKYGSMEEDELSAWEEKVGFNEFTPIEVFETVLGVSGKMLYDKQKRDDWEWINSGTSDENPLNDIFIFAAEQAVHSIYHEVCIKSTIYQFRTDALVVFSLDRLEEWYKIRQLVTIDLDESILIKDTGEDEGGRIYFTCKDDGVLNSTTHPSIFSGNDYAYWKVVGRRDLTNMCTMHCVLINYKYTGVNNQGGLKFKKVKRNCNIITTYQKFFQEQYRGIISKTFLGRTESEETQSLLANVNKKKVENNVKALLQPYTGNYATIGIFDFFKRGVYEHPTLAIRFNTNPIIEQQITMKKTR